MTRYKYVDNKRIELTAAEEAEVNAREKVWADNAPTRKLKKIKDIRLQKLQETDYMANSDYTMPEDVKTWRQTMRDIPANYTTEAEYDEVLARDANGNLTHSVWSK